MRIPKLNKVKYYPTFTEMIDSLFSNKGDAPVISWFNRKGEEQTVSAEKLYSDVIGLKESLISQGLSGRHIAILSENSYEWLLVYFAATYCGAVVVCRDIEQSNDTIEQMLEMAVREELPLIFYENERENSIKKILAGKEFSSAAVVIGPEGGFEPEEVSSAVSAGMTSASLGERILRCETAPGCAICAIMYETDNI